MDDVLKEAIKEKNILVDDMQSIILSTTDKNGSPNSSYAPSAIDDNHNYYIYISRLSKHTNNLLNNSPVSMMIINDESKTEHIFGRKRLTMNAVSTEIKRDTEEWNNKMDLMEKKFGESITYLKNLTDFHLFKLDPQDGLLVHGFARAFKLSGSNLDEIKYLNDKGHSSKK